MFSMMHIDDDECIMSVCFVLANFHLPGSANASQLCDNADIVA